MSTPYVGEIRIVGFNFAPTDWAFCDGSLIDISQNPTLFDLIGTTYGGDGQTTYALPNLQSRIPIHQGSDLGSTFVLGQIGGEESVTLTTSQIPAHTHVPQANSGGGTANSPPGNVWANWTGSQYSDQRPGSLMNAGVMGSTGGSQPHENRPPFLAVYFIISLYGVFPSQS
jgi:microcystin-dependent protein